MKTVFIYALNDPTRQHLGKTRYIGKAKDPYVRYARHLTNNCREKTHKAHWIRSLLQIGKAPVLEILDEVPEVEWQMWECEWIRLYRALGFDLTNVTDGGDGMCNPTKETREKMRVAKLGEKCHWFGKSHSVSIEIREKLRAANLGKTYSLETRARMSAAQCGRKHSEETRAKMSAAQSGENHPMFGKTHSSEARVKISEAQSGEKNHMFGKTHSAEARAKIGEASARRTRSEETRAKISKTLLGRSRCKSFD